LVSVIVAAAPAMRISVSKFSLMCGWSSSRTKYQTVALGGTTLGWSPPSGIT
jgi:hypothetical protein